MAVSTTRCILVQRVVDAHVCAVHVCGHKYLLVNVDSRTEIADQYRPAFELFLYIGVN